MTLLLARKVVERVVAVVLALLIQVRIRVFMLLRLLESNREV